MSVSASQVKELRERTGLGMMDCKKALEEAGGDIELAIENMRKNSSLKAAKKAGRTAADGLLGLCIAPDGSKAALVEVNIETDFAARNEKFIAFVDRVAGLVFEQGNDDVAALLASGVDGERETLVQEIGENISIRRAAYVAPAAGGRVAHYLHTNKRQAALVEISGGDEELGKDLAMHVTALNPLVVAQADVAPELVAKEREIATSQAAESGKPPEIVEKMVEGKVRKYLADISLLDQAFVKDDKVKVKKLLDGQSATIARFVRFEVGEGIEVDEVDFASEVAAQIRGSDDSQDQDKNQDKDQDQDKDKD